jgi:hypothetical protein
VSKLKALNLKFRKGLIEHLTLNLFLSLHISRQIYGRSINLLYQGCSVVDKTESAHLNISFHDKRKMIWKLFSKQEHNATPKRIHIIFLQENKTCKEGIHMFPVFFMSCFLAEETCGFLRLFIFSRKVSHNRVFIYYYEN